MKKAILVFLIGLLVFAHSQKAIGESKRTIQVGTFRYLQCEEGKVKANQVENRRARRIYLEQPVAEVIRKSIAEALSALKFTIKTPSDHTIQGTIKNLLVEDIAYFVEYFMEIQFDVLAADNTVYSKAFKAFRRREKAPFTDRMARQMVVQCVKAFVRDASKKGVL